MGSITHKLLYLLVLSTLTVPATGTTIKTRYVVDDGQGFWSTEAPLSGEAAEGNPGYHPGRAAQIRARIFRPPDRAYCMGRRSPSVLAIYPGHR